MLSENLGPFPYLTVRSVILDQNETTVNAAITVRDDSPRPFWLNEREFSAFVKIYLIMIPHTELRGRVTDLGPTQLVNYKTRAFAQNNGQDVSAALNWDKEFYDSCDHSIITLTEALDSASDSLVTTSEIDRNVDNLNDLNFTVTIPRTKYNYENEQLVQLDLYALTHLDVKGLVEHYNMTSRSSTIYNLLEIGGNFSVETLLERPSSGPLQVPATKEILAYQDNTIFNGIYHFHPSSSPGPGGYVGFMEGPSDPMHPNAKRLKTITVEYNKVTANFLLDDSLFLSGYNGSRQELEALDYSFLTPYVETRSIYDSADTTLGFQTGLSAGVYDNAEQQNLRKEYFEELARNSDFEIVSKTAGWIHTAEDEDGNIKGSHSLLFEIDWEKIVRVKSKYGFFLDLLRKNPITPSSGVGFVLKTDLRTLLNKVDIKEITIYRTRVSNQPRSNNPVGTADYDTFNLNELPKKLISTRDEYNEEVNKNILIKKQNENCVIAQINLSRPYYKKRTIRLEDKDMFKNISFGNYEYHFEMRIEDKIKGIFMLAASTLQIYAKEYKSFLNAASIPYIERPFFGADSSFIEPGDTIARVGNYIIKSEQYTPAFKSESENTFDYNTRRLINLYIIMSAWIGQYGEDADLQARNRLVQLLENSIIPKKGGNLESAYKFLEACQRLIIEYRRLLDRENVEQIDSFILNSSVDSYAKIGKKHPTKSPGNIEIIKKVIPGTVTAFRKGEIFLSYDMDDVNEVLQRRQTYLDSPVNLDDPLGIRDLLPPSRYLTQLDSENIQMLAQINTMTGGDLQAGMTGIDLSVLENTLTTPPENTSIDLSRGSRQIDNVFGAGGVTVTFPTNEFSLPNDADISRPLTDTKPLDLTSGLSQNLEQGLTDSITREDITQTYTRNSDAFASQANSRTANNILGEVQNALGQSDILESGSPANRRTALPSTTDRLFGQKASRISMVVNRNGPFSETVPLTEEAINSADSDVIVLAVSGEEGRSSGQSYLPANNVAAVSVQQARALASESTSDSDSNTNQSNASSAYSPPRAAQNIEAALPRTNIPRVGSAGNRNLPGRGGYSL
tara:strand:- start:209 stop:3430 length:3222 start_codon:yes stop_codon:yes gene_type:complete